MMRTSLVWTVACLIVAFGLVACGGGAGNSDPAAVKSIFTDPANDISIDFIDITGASLAIDSENIVFEISLRNLPTLLTFNQTNVPMNYLEYKWQIEFDIDNDNVTDYSLSASYFKSSSTSVSGSILSNTQQNVWKHNASGGASYLVSASSSLIGNTMRLSVAKSAHPDLTNITSTATVKINTYYESDSATSFSDSI